MSSFDRPQGPDAAPRALGAASASTHSSSSERDEAGAGPRAQDYDSRSYSAGSGPQYGEPS